MRGIWNDFERGGAGPLERGRRNEEFLVTIRPEDRRPGRMRNHVYVASGNGT